MGIRTRRAHTHSRTHVVGFGIAGVFGFIALFVVALSLSVGAVVESWLQDLPDYQSADSYLVAEPTQVYDADGNKIVDFYLQKRRSVDLSDISDYVVKATVDTEDIRFYSHNGVDPQGIARAVVVQLTGGSEGASTITQQLVRNTVLSDEQFDYTLKRKVREAYIAIQMEKEFSKSQILNMYLNTIYYGNGAYGIEAASITYFNKHASELSLAEAALLVGIPNSPSYYDPTAHPDASVQRRNVVLDRMLSAGDISQEEYDAAVATPLELNPGELTDPVGDYPYFTDYVKSLLLQDFDSDTVLQGGLKVYTTLDPEYQKVAEDTVNERLDYTQNQELGAALVCIDNSNGYVKAMVGGRDYSTSQFNLATQASVQAGSSFKTFTLTAAVNEGMNPNIMLNCSSPMQVTPTWLVRNFGNHQYGTRSLASATAISSNTGYAQVAVAIGAQKIVDMAHTLGIDSHLDAYPSITLGAVGVAPLEMCEAYSTIASGGLHRDPVVITRIEDRNGNVVYEHQDNPTQAISAAVAQDVTEVLEGVVTGSATGYYIANHWKNKQPVAGKTGTSDNAENLWFCGFTPQLTTVVWCGYPNKSNTAVTIRGGTTGTTQNTVQPIFTNFMNTMLDGVAKEEFPTTKETVAYKPNSSWTFASTSRTYQVVTSVKENTRTTTGEVTGTTADSTTTTTTTTTNSTTGGGTTGGGTTGGGTTGGNTGGTTTGGTTGGGSTSAETSGGGTGGNTANAGGETKTETTGN